MSLLQKRAAEEKGERRHACKWGSARFPTDWPFVRLLLEARAASLQRAEVVVNTLL